VGKLVRFRLFLAAVFYIAIAGSALRSGEAQPREPSPVRAVVFNDSHLHLTNYIQEGPDIRELLKIMGDNVERVALFGIPLQQHWSYRVSGDDAPNYYLRADTPLYYYSFTDAYIAMEFKRLTQEQQKRIDPMITGFNPADMYAADHVRRVLTTFPGVFSGIGEFTIHKEFVTSKIAGEVPSLNDQALDRLLEFCAEVGLLAILHNDMDTPFPKKGAKPAYLDQMRALLKKHSKTTIVWAHMGVGRVVRPVQNHVRTLEAILGDPAYKHVYFDLSWDEVAKYVVSSEEALSLVAGMLNRYPDRFLFGTDEVAPTNPQSYTKIFFQYGPLWNLLRPETRDQVLRKNHERLFDEARRKVRAWEKKNVKGTP
jgi:hypothetical protein